MDFRAPHPLVHPSHAGHPYYYPGIFLSFFFSLSLSITFSSAIILVFSFEFLFAWIPSEIYEWKFQIFDSDSESRNVRLVTTISSLSSREPRGWLSPKFLASAIDVRCSWKGRRGEGKEISSPRERGARLALACRKIVHTAEHTLAIFLTTWPYFASGWSPRI